jgi:hypothetical protein
MKRNTQRRLALLAITAFGVSLIAGVFDDVWLFRELSAKYLGYFCIALAVLGLLGVNVWRGGPLDLRRDNDEPQG